MMLKVRINRDGEQYFAQGMKCDYYAGGSTIEETKDNFLRGLQLTIVEHLKMHGDLSRFVEFELSRAAAERAAIQTEGGA